MGLLAFQENFAKAVRQPEGSTLPWTAPVLDKPERMAVYQELVFNNIKTFVDACFPVACACLGEESWLALNQAFIAQHRCTTPFFREIPAEFVTWVEALYRPSEAPEDGPLATAGANSAPNQLVQNLNLPDHLPHLLHYEWLELCVQTHVNGDPFPDPMPNVEQQFLSVDVNPTLQLACYPYAVHKIVPGQPVCAELSCLMVWRNANFTVQFAHLQPASYLLLEALLQGQAGQAATNMQCKSLHDLAQELCQYVGQTLGTTITPDLVQQELLRLQNLGVLIPTVLRANSHKRQAASRARNGN